MEHLQRRTPGAGPRVGAGGLCSALSRERAARSSSSPEPPGDKPDDEQPACSFEAGGAAQRMGARSAPWGGRSTHASPRLSSAARRKRKPRVSTPWLSLCMERESRGEHATVSNYVPFDEL